MRRKARLALKLIALLLAIVAMWALERVMAPHYAVLKCNFHIHTTYSDGAYAPSEVVALYKNAGYDCIAITDHDTTAGYQAAYDAGLQQNLIVIRGEEISCEFADCSDKHILGLFLETTIPKDQRIWRTQEVKPYFDLIHDQGGLGIVAHSWDNWLIWGNYQYESYIDGWEYAPWTTSHNMEEWLFGSSGRIYMLDHDFHGEGMGDITRLEQYYTLLLCHTRTSEGAREALTAGRIAVYALGNYFGNPSVLALLAELRHNTLRINQGSLCLQPILRKACESIRSLQLRDPICSI